MIAQLLNHGGNGAVGFHHSIRNGPNSKVHELKSSQMNPIRLCQTPLRINGVGSAPPYEIIPRRHYNRRFISNHFCGLFGFPSTVY